MGAMGELYSAFSNTARRKAAAAPGLPMALFCPTVLGGQKHAEDDAKLSSIWYGKRYHKTMMCFLSHVRVKSQPCLSEGHSGLLLPLPYGCFSSLPGLFLFPAHITAGFRPALPGTGLRLLLVPIRSHSMLQEVALLWLSSTSGPAWAEQGRPACANMSLLCADKPQHPPSCLALPPQRPWGARRVCQETSAQLWSSTRQLPNMVSHL